MKKSLILLGLAFLLIAATGIYLVRPIAESHPALTRSDLPPLIPLREFYANADERWRYRLSPNGQKLAWLEAKWLRPALWVRPLDDENTDIFHTDDRVRWYRWSSDSRFLLYLADRDGWENDVLVSVDTTTPGAQPRTFDFGKNVRTYLEHIPTDGGADIIVAHNARDRSRFDLYRLNLDSGETEPLDLSLDQGTHWSFDRSGEIFARKRFLSGSQWQQEIRDGEDWRVLLSGGMEDAFYLITGPDDTNSALAYSNLGRDTTALVRVDLTTGRFTEISARPDVDFGGVVLHPEDDRPLIALNSPGYQQRVFFDETMREHVEALNLPERSALHFRSYADDFSKVLVSVEEAEAGFHTKLIDTQNQTVESISEPAIAQFRNHLSPVEPVFIPASDGLTIPGFVSKPVGVTGPAPMVMLIHGGPVARSFWGYQDLRAWLNNRGYAVLDVNYRGSAGYGRAFREAAIREVSRKMHQDIVDARQWAIDQGVADPQNVAVVGGSFGGLKVLTALTQTPELFAAGVDINGISDLTTMLQEVPVYWRGWPDWYRKYIGDPDDATQLEDIIDRSPIAHVDKISSPLLIIQGSNDVRVVRDQADRLVDALKAQGKPHELLLVDGAGHQFANWSWQQRLLAMRRIERFLAAHIGGRADGFDYAVLGAHIIPQ
ncbi:MAG: S9 family peptidase [Alphaproteobacteria bacterium]|nr:S9 family peptidase [Alphaproteobacteria bacterium]